MVKNTFDLNFFVSKAFIVLYLSIGFVPNLEAVDKIAPQWVFMSILNILSLIYLYRNREDYGKAITLALSSRISIIYICFIFFAGGSYFYAINPTEVIVNITRQFNVLIMTLCLTFYLIKLKNKRTFLASLISIFLFVEVYYVLDQLIGLLNSNLSISDRSTLKGVAANPNITAFSISAKIPFLIYLILNSNKSIIRVILSILLFASVLSLTAIQSRASYLAIIFIYFSTTIVLILFYKRSILIKKLSTAVYLIIPLLFAILSNQIFLAENGADVIERFNTIKATETDNSINARLRYYSHVLQHIKENPILGTGLGNWKLKSIEYDSKNIEGYIVPYHAHSDFIQLGAELGVIGFFLYLGVFLFTFYYGFKLIKNSKLITEQRVFISVLIIALIVYSIDANLNFPIARPQVLVIWSLIIASIIAYYKNNSNDNKKLLVNKNYNLIFVWITLLLLLPTLYITITVYKSLKGQMLLLQDFNSNQYNLSLNRIDNIVPEIPNITVTTIPINSIKARYYVNAKKYDKAISLLENGTKANPYLYYSEILKSQIFQERGQLDSAKFYAKKAFFGLPNNDLHSSRYVNLINITKDEKLLDEAFDLLVYKNKKINWKNYLVIASNLNNKKLVLNRAKQALSIFPGDKEIKGLHDQILLGSEAINKSIYYSKKGLEFFQNQDFKNAAYEFEKALELNPLDYANFENAASANYMNGNLQKALDQINFVINELNPLNGKCEYIKALIFIKMGDPIGACPLLLISKKYGFSNSGEMYDQYCN